MRYKDTHKQEWLKTTTNYLISKAYEMAAFPLWAEQFQSRVITELEMQGLAQSGNCIDNDPVKLSRGLLGFLSLCLTGDEKLTFSNATPGNVFDAWRRIVVSIGPRSEA